MNARLSASHVAGTTRAFSARQPHSLQVHCSLSIDRRIHGKFSKKICSVLGASRERSMLHVCCMANARRMARVSKQIEREIGILFVSDKVVQAAVCPERRRGIDDGLSALASVTEVEISNDLQVAKVYLSIYSDESGKNVAMRGLKNIEGYVRKHIGRKIRLRLTPEIRFILDDSIERSERVLSLLKRVESINAGDAPPPPVSIADDFDDVIQTIPLETSLFIVVSKSGGTEETQVNMQRLVDQCGDSVYERIVVITSPGSVLDVPNRYRQVFYLDKKTGGRYSGTSVVGGLIISIALGTACWDSVLQGAYAMDQQVQIQDPGQNIALAMALIWRYQRQDSDVQVIIPYAQALALFPNHLQQLICESNGKSVTQSGAPVLGPTSPVVFGQTGTVIP